MFPGSGLRLTSDLKVKGFKVPVSPPQWVAHEHVQQQGANCPPGGTEAVADRELGRAGSRSVIPQFSLLPQAPTWLGRVNCKFHLNVKFYHPVLQVVCTNFLILHFD